MPTATITTTRVFDDNARAYRDGKRRALNEGGTSSTKTYSILQLLILLAQSAKSQLLISVVSESLPHLKRGCIRDFFNILDEPQDNNPRYSKTEFTYTFGSGGVIEFFGADNPDKVRGPRRQILFLNEANNIPWETARGLDKRTEIFTFADWNPTGEFWAHENWIGRPENAYIHSTYQDAREVLPRSVVENIESERDRDPNWWNVYGLGLVGKIEGLVYPLFEQSETMPMGAVFYGLDFGFTTDPAVLVENVIIGGDLYSREVFYARGLTNDDIARKMTLAKVQGTIWCDAAEPKSIEELQRKGFNVRPSEKGPGSVEYGHQRVRQYFQHWTKDSLNCIKEQRNFRYIKNIQGVLTDKSTHEFSHGMDARRYAVASHRIGSSKGASRNYAGL